MTTIRATVGKGRSVSADDFADITTTPVAAIAWTSDGWLEIAFADTLTVDERQRVVIRCLSESANEERALLQARHAHQSNVTYLDATTHTAAEASAQVEALTRQVNALIRYVARL